MAATSYGVNHPLAVKVWAKKLFVEALKATYASKFMGKGSDALCQIRSELNKGAGDRITVGLRMQMTGTGVSGDGTLEGNEEALATYSDNIFIDQLRHAVRSGGKMSEQRVPFSVREEARSGLQDWWADRIDSWFFNQLAGNTLQTDTKYTGMQATVAPSNKVYPASVNASDELSISTTDKFKLEYIDYAKELAETRTTPIRPLKINGQDKYVIFLHPYQVTDLRVATSSGQWLDIQKAAMDGGKVSENPIFTGALGEYNGVILHRSTRVPGGISNAGAAVANTRRAIFCGAQAALMAYGENGDGEMSWVEELFDYKNQLGVSAGMIGGLKKATFNSVDHGVIVIPTYAAAHAS
jgi:N4-gp56 family major capsid protein